MIILIIVCGVLTVLIITLLIKIFGFKSDIRQLADRLENILQIETNTLLTTQSFDDDITALIKNINGSLVKNRRDSVTIQRIEADLKRAILNISHDLRTPLTSAKGYLQMLEGTVEQARYLEIIQGRLDSLSVLMDNLFAFSRALEEKVSLEKINLSNILRDAVLESYVELERKGFVVESSVPDVPVYCIGDEDAIRRVLQNLISNAYTHGKEYLKVELTGNTIKIYNKADGLKDLDISRIFDRFYTADAARTHKRTGLGLAIAKELVVKMNWEISAAVENDMLVVHSTFAQ